MGYFYSVAAVDVENKSYAFLGGGKSGEFELSFLSDYKTLKDKTGSSTWKIIVIGEDEYEDYDDPFHQLDEFGLVAVLISNILDYMEDDDINEDYVPNEWKEVYHWFVKQGYKKLDKLR